MAIVERAPQASVPFAHSANALHPVMRLAVLHAEARATARLANLLGRSIHAASALVLMGIAALAFGGAGLAESVTWAIFVLAAAGAIVAAYRRTINRPFEPAALKSFSQDLHAILVFAGFAWGAGAFLALSAGAAMSAVLMFATGTCAVMALLLRDQQSVFLFLAPVAALSSFACVFRPLANGYLGAASVLVACGIVAAAAAGVAHATAQDTEMPEWAGFPQA